LKHTLNLTTGDGASDCVTVHAAAGGVAVAAQQRNCSAAECSQDIGDPESPGKVLCLSAD
jgi:hypothetical protein